MAESLSNDFENIFLEIRSEDWESFLVVIQSALPKVFLLMYSKDT